MSGIKYNVKLKITHFIRNLMNKQLRHYAWPRRLSTRLFDFDEFYGPEITKNHPTKRVNIGAGPYFKRAGWKSADYLPSFSTSQKDLVHLDLLQNLDEFPFSNLEAIYTSHTFEHFQLGMTKRLIKSSYNSLKPGGYLRVVVPDAKLILSKVRDGNTSYFRFFESYFKNHKDMNVDVYDYGLLLLCTPLCRVDRIDKNNIDGTTKFKKLITSSTDDEIINILNDHNYRNDEEGSKHLSCYGEELMIEMLKQVGFSNVYRSAFMQSSYGPMREAPIFDGTHPWMSLYIEAVK